MEVSSVNNNNGNNLPTSTQAKSNFLQSHLHKSNNYCLNNNGTDKLNNNEDVRALINELVSRVVINTVQQSTQPEAKKYDNHEIIMDHEKSSNDVDKSRELPESILEPPTSDRLKLKENEELDEGAKDIVTLKNLELTPPPEDISKKRKHGSELNDSLESCSDKQANKTTDKDTSVDQEEGSGTRSKRRRRQTELFQVGDKKEQESARTTRSRCNLATKPANTTKKEQPQPQATTTNSTNKNVPNDLQDVIFYEKNDYLAIRNEENSFYLCQLAENVRVKRPLIKVKWLDTDNDGKTYYLTAHYDKVPQKSIIMPVILTKLKSEKKGEQIFTLDEQDKFNIMERLKRSLNAPTESNVEQ